MPRIFTTIFLFFWAGILSAQNGRILHSIIRQGDTIPSVWLEEAVVRGKNRTPGWYRRQHRRNARLEYNVRKVYPFAVTAAAQVREIEQRLSGISQKSDRRKIIKEEYARLMRTFKAPLMRLSITQGKILVRLIYRETSHTSFAHIREYRGTVNAYFWQSIAILFGNNLKADYDPYGKDAEIEEIIRQIQQENKNNGMQNKSGN